MKTKETSGTHYVPAHRAATNSTLNKIIDYFLPEECRARTRADFYNITAIACICTSPFIPYCLIGAIYCVIKAHKEKGNRS